MQYRENGNDPRIEDDPRHVSIPPAPVEIHVEAILLQEPSDPLGPMPGRIPVMVALLVDVIDGSLGVAEQPDFLLHVYQLLQGQKDRLELHIRGGGLGDAFEVSLEVTFFRLDHRAGPAFA